MFEQLSLTQMILIVLLAAILALVAAFIRAYTTKRNLTDIGNDIHVSSDYNEDTHYQRGFQDARKGLQPVDKSEAYLDGFSDGSAKN